jgi:hypothetical protein
VVTLLRGFETQLLHAFAIQIDVRYKSRPSHPSLFYRRKDGAKVHIMKLPIMQIL